MDRPQPKFEAAAQREDSTNDGDWNFYRNQITTMGQVAKVNFEIARSKMRAARWLRPRTAAMIGGLLFSTSLSNVAAGDATSAAQTLLSQATSQIQNMVISMSEGCSGGAHGVPPVSWARLQPHGNAAVNALTAASVSLASKNISNALQQINIAQGELDELLNGVHGNCSGGAHGIDPVGMGGYLATRASVQGRLDDVKIFLGG